MTNFKEINKIASIEFAGVKRSLPGLSKRGMSLLLFYTVLATALFLYIYGSKIEDVTHLIAGVCMFILSVSLFIALFSMLQFTNALHREWWLTLPYPRTVIAYAKLVSSIRIMGLVSVPVIIGSVIYYFVAINRWSMQVVPLPQLIASVSVFALLAIVATPLVVMMGLLVSTLYRGWVRWIYIVPYFIVVASSFSTIIMVQMIHVNYLSTSHILLYALVGVCVGWPLTYLLMRYIASEGMYSMASMNTHTKSIVSINNERNKTNVKISPEINTKKSGFRALYQLERSRYIHLGSLTLIRLIIYVIALIIGVVAYISAMKIGSMGVLVFSVFFVTLPLIIPVFWSMMINVSEAQKKRLDWWLSYPHSRIQLVVARLAAIWMTAMRFAFWMSVVFWTATVISMMIHASGTEHLQLSLEWYIYTIVLYAATMAISMAVIQIQSLSAKSSVLGILLAPLFFAVFYQTALLMDYFLPNELGTVDFYPDWTRLILLIVIGLPAGIASIRLGAKYLNSFLSQITPAFSRTKNS